jgi:hypothetical protein
MNKSVLWNNFKLHIQGKCIEPSERIRLKFYRAMNLYLRMSCHTPDYIQGFMDGLKLDSETREFLLFINDCIYSDVGAN